MMITMKLQHSSGGMHLVGMIVGCCVQFRVMGKAERPVVLFRINCRLDIHRCCCCCCC